MRCFPRYRIQSDGIELLEAGTHAGLRPGTRILRHRRVGGDVRLRVNGHAKKLVVIRAHGCVWIWYGSVLVRVTVHDELSSAADEIFQALHQFRRLRESEAD